MARWEFKLPDIGEGIAEGEIVAWKVSPGDDVREDQAVVEVMTDKATVTLTAPRAGRVVEIRGQVGETVAVHGILVVFELDDVAETRSLPGADRTVAAQRTADDAERTPHHNGAQQPRSVREAPSSSAASVGHGGSTASCAPRGADGAAAYFNAKPLATPATRKLARDMTVDLRRVPPTGPQGRVTRTDVEAYCAASARTPPEREAERARDEPSMPSPAPTQRGAMEQRIPFAGLRRRIAAKMTLATSKVAHFTFVEECDGTQLKALRDRLKDEARDQGVKLTFLPFIAKAVVASLRKHPMLNATLDEAAQEIVLQRAFNIGIATATEGGLMVPVVKNADRLSLLGLAREIERLTEDARVGRAKLEDLQESTFTITSLGMQGGLLATPIVNFPEVAILGVHRMKQRPVVKSGQIAIADVMLLSLSFDHRVVDGHVGAAFAYDVIAYLEQPERLLLDMA